MREIHHIPIKFWSRSRRFQGFQYRLRYRYQKKGLDDSDTNIDTRDGQNSIPIPILIPRLCKCFKVKYEEITANVLSGKIPAKNSVHLGPGIMTGVIHVTNSTGKSRYFYFPTFYRSCQFQWKILSKTGFWSKAVTWISLIWQWIFPGKVS